MSQLQLNTTCKPTSWNARAEGKGDGCNMAGDLKCEALLQASDLKALVGSIDAKSFERLKNSGAELVIGHKIEGAEVAISSAVVDGFSIYDDKEADLKAFKLSFAEGDMFNASFSIGVRGLSEEDAGALHNCITRESIYVVALSKQTGLDLTPDNQEPAD